MTPPPQPDLQNSLKDPRCSRGFLPQHHPRVNGREAPPVDTTEGNERITIEFLAAYYHLNCEYSRLLEVRRSPVSPCRCEAEKNALQAIEKVLIVRDSLEDRYAPLGVITEPVVQDGFTVDLNIRFGNVDAAGGRRTDAYTLTAYVPIPMPEGAKFEDVHMNIEGPGFNGGY
jgi:hypothetical protein